MTTKPTPTNLLKRDTSIFMEHPHKAAYVLVKNSALLHAQAEFDCIEPGLLHAQGHNILMVEGLLRTTRIENDAVRRHIVNILNVARQVVADCERGSIADIVPLENDPSMYQSPIGEVTTWDMLTHLATMTWWNNKVVEARTHQGGADYEFDAIKAHVDCKQWVQERDLPDTEIARDLEETLRASEEFILSFTETTQSVYKAMRCEVGPTKRIKDALAEEPLTDPSQDDNQRAGEILMVLASNIARVAVGMNFDAPENYVPSLVASHREAFSFMNGSPQTSASASQPLILMHAHATDLLATFGLLKAPEADETWVAWAHKVAPVVGDEDDHDWTILTWIVELAMSLVAVRTSRVHGNSDVYVDELIKSYNGFCRDIQTLDQHRLSIWTNTLNELTKEVRKALELNGCCPVIRRSV